MNRRTWQGLLVTVLQPLLQRSHSSRDFTRPDMKLLRAQIEHDQDGGAFCCATQNAPPS